MTIFNLNFIYSNKIIDKISNKIAVTINNTIHENINDKIKQLFHTNAEIFENISKNPSKKEKTNRIRIQLNKILDLFYMSNFILGKSKRNLDEKSIKHFIELYSNHLIRHYSDVFLNLKTDNYKITKIINDTNNKELYLVHIKTKFKRNLINMIFKLNIVKGKILIIDILTEDISFISLERNMLNKKIMNIGFETLIDELIKEENGTASEH